MAKGENIDVYAEFRVMAAQIKVEAEKQRKAKMGEESIKEDSNEEMKEEMQEAAKPTNSDKGLSFSYYNYCFHCHCYYF